MCLDGTPAGVYFSPGNGLDGGSRKTVVYFEGGGWCSGLNSDQVLSSCYDRSSTPLGSSHEWKNPDDYDYVFRADKEQDRFYHNWNRFVIKYCDGGRH